MEFFAGIGAGWMNLASLALGLLAWMLPVAAMIRTAARPRALHPALPLVCVSFAACAAALYLQLRYHAHLSRIEDVGPTHQERSICQRRTPLANVCLPAAVYRRYYCLKVSHQ